MNDIFDKVNRYGVLKVPFSLWAMIVFQARHWILVAIVMAGLRRSPETARLLGEGVPYLQLALSVPVLLLADAIFNRAPEAGAYVRWVWRHGRQIVTLTACLNLAWVGWYLAGVERWRPWPENFVLLTGLIDLLIIAAVWKSAYYREMFSEFPPPRS